MSVKLRKKKIAGGKISLYLDIYHNGQRQYEFLKLYLFKGTNTATKVANNETLVLAETITAKRQIEINHSEYGLIPKFKKEALKGLILRPKWQTMKHLYLLKQSVQSGK